MRVECLHPAELTDGDIAVWRALLSGDPNLASPYLAPEWAMLVGRHRADTRVVVWRDAAGSPHAFLPVQRPDNFAAAPAGGPVCDYQALIAAPGADIDLTQAARALGVGRIDLPAGLRDNAVAPFLLTRDAGHLVDFPEGWTRWCEARQAAGSKTVARTRKKLNKFTRDVDGQVTFDAFSTDTAAFETLIAWKRDQMRRTGVADIFQHAWIDAIVRGAFAAPADDPHFGGAMFVLRVKGEPAAVLFCLRAEKTLHAWFVAHDAQWHSYSPGLIVFVEAIRAAADAGFTAMDLGPGDYQFKESLANGSRPIGAGFVGGASFASALKAAQFQVRALVEGLPVGPVRQWPAKAMRRLDIARGLAAPSGRAA